MRRIKFVLVLLYFFTLSNIGKAQDIMRSKNNIFLELGGNGGLFSINYERALNTNLNGRVGFGNWTSSFLGGKETKITTIPVMLNHLVGKRKSFFEIGGGFLFGNKNENNISSLIFDLTAFLGYRYQAPGDGILFRIGMTPFLSLDSKANYPDKAFISGGFSIGYHF